MMKMGTFMRGMAVGVAAGILLGRRRFRQADGVFTLSFLLTLLGGLVCWCLLPFCGFFSGILSNNGSIMGDVARYTFFTLLSAPFVGLNLILSGFAIVFPLPSRFRSLSGHTL